MLRPNLIAASAALVIGATGASAGTVLVINGASQTSETGTTNSITTNITNLHADVGNTVTVVDDVPASLAAFDQVWDIRFSNVWAIDAAEQATYLSYLQGGGGMFVMGENSAFTTRNDSVFSLIAAAGGGTLGFTSGSALQTVVAPFTGPNPVTTVAFRGPGYINGTGSGDWITQSGASGVGVAWGVGDLSNAPAGALTTIFDVNFMQTTASPDEQSLTKNLIGFIDDEVVQPSAVPLPAGLPLLLAGLAAFGLVGRKRA
jgi:hypothetical protein